MIPNAITKGGEKAVVLNETKDGVKTGYILRGHKHIQTQWHNNQHWAGTSNLDLKC